MSLISTRVCRTADKTVMLQKDAVHCNDIL